jgi:hypothetical protein
MRILCNARTAMALAVLVAAVGLTACAQTQFASVWRSDAYAGGAVQKVMVIAYVEEKRVRIRFENTMTEFLNAAGVEAVQSYPYLVSDLTRENAIKAADKTGATAVLLTQVIGVEEQIYHYEPRHRNLRHLRKYRRTPVSYATTESVRLITNLFDRQTEDMIWSAVSNTLRPADEREGIDSVAKALVKQLRGDGFIP